MKTKEEQSIYFKNWLINNREKRIEYNKKWRENNKEKCIEYENKAKILYKDKRAIRYITRSAVKIGKIVRGSCEICGEEKVEAHHEDYNKPLEIKWLCVKHHHLLHSN